MSQTSHCNIKGLSVTEVMRIENMITQVKFCLIFEQLLHTISVRNVWKHKRRICNLTPGLKGLTKLSSISFSEYDAVIAIVFFQ